MEKINVEKLEQMVQEVSGWNSQLEEYDYKFMEDLEIFTEGQDVIWVLQRAHYGDFNITHDRFNFDAYGNLESLTERDYQELLYNNSDEIVEVYNELVEAGEIEAV